MIYECETQIKSADLDQLFYFTHADLCYSLCRFVTEVKREDESDFQPSTIRSLVLLIQMYLHSHSLMWKLLDGDNFHELRFAVDNQMKGVDSGWWRYTYIIRYHNL